MWWGRLFFSGSAGRQATLDQRSWPLGRYPAEARVCVSLLLLLSFSRVACAQSTAEAAQVTSGSATVSAAKPKIKLPSFVQPTPGDKNNTEHLTFRPGPSPEETNRKAFEAQAGKTAAKILFRSAPSKARVWLNGTFVGTTPLLLILAPGKYRVEMRDDRLGFAEAKVDVLPTESRNLQLWLAPRYPSQVRLR